jgi:hypothetical protein
MSAPEACCTLAAPEEDCEDSSGSETEPAPAFHRQLSTKEASKGAVVSDAKISKAFAAAGWAWPR